MNPGEIIKEFRKKKKLTQGQFGEKIGFSDAFISEIEKGKKEPSKKFTRRLIEVFGFTWDILDGNESAIPKPKEFIARIEIKVISWRYLFVQNRGLISHCV